MSGGAISTTEFVSDDDSWTAVARIVSGDRYDPATGAVTVAAVEDRLD